MNLEKPTTGQGLLVTLVDDDASVRISTGRLLRALGFRAEAFASAHEFLIRGHLEDSACLLVDVWMPGVDGLELQRHLAETRYHIPIVFVTAIATDNEERRAFEGGAIDFLRKPISAEDLVRAIQAALMRVDGIR